jgi:hypothetical protein
MSLTVTVTKMICSNGQKLELEAAAEVTLA